MSAISFLAQLLQFSARIQALLVGVMLACIASGVLFVLLPLKMQSSGNSAVVIGSVMAGYSIGFLFGSHWGSNIIAGIGHNRSYAASAGFIVIAANLHSFVDSVYVEIVLRFTVGFAMVMIYLTLESWLNATSERQSRGTIFALYQFFVSLGFLLSPFIAYWFDYSDFRAYGMVSMIIALSMIPIVMTRFPSPEIGEVQERLPMIEMLRDTPSGAVMTFFSGLVMSALLNLLSLYANWLQFDANTAALLLAITTGSSLVFQIPVGKLADYVDERKIMLGLCLVGIVAVSLIILSTWLDLGALLTFLGLFVLGGCTFCFYPLSMKFIFNQMDSDKAVPAMSTLLLINSFGLILGPIIGSFFMNWLSPIGLMYYLLMMMLCGALFMSIRVARASTADEDAETIPYMISFEMLKPMNSNLDPRSEFFVTKIRNKTIRALASSIGVSPAKSHQLISEHLQYLEGFSAEEILSSLVMLKPRLAKAIIRAMLLLHPDKVLDFTHALGDLISMRKNLINKLLRAGLCHRADETTIEQINELFDYYSNLSESTSSTDAHAQRQSEHASH